MEQETHGETALREAELVKHLLMEHRDFSKAAKAADMKVPQAWNRFCLTRLADDIKRKIALHFSEENHLALGIGVALGKIKSPDIEQTKKILGDSHQDVSLFSEKERLHAIQQYILAGVVHLKTSDAVEFIEGAYEQCVLDESSDLLQEHEENSRITTAEPQQVLEEVFEETGMLETEPDPASLSEVHTLDKVHGSPQEEENALNTKDAAEQPPMEGDTDLVAPEQEDEITFIPGRELQVTPSCSKMISGVTFLSADSGSVVRDGLLPLEMYIRYWKEGHLPWEKRGWPRHFRDVGPKKKPGKLPTLEEAERMLLEAQAT